MNEMLRLIMFKHNCQRQPTLNELPVTNMGILLILCVWRDPFIEQWTLLAGGFIFVAILILGPTYCNAYFESGVQTLATSE